MPEYRRGVAAVNEAAERKGSGDFRPFVPEIRWREDGEKKYILVLTPADEVGTFDLHEWIPVGKREKVNGETYTQYETFLSRKDPFVDEDFDKISDELERPPKTRCFGVAVELEPVLENIKGRQRPVGFAVKTDTFTRKTDDGEEEVTMPLIGLIVQSSSLVWKHLVALDESNPLSEVPIEVVRNGTSTNTQYTFVPFMDVPVDLTPVIEYVDGISYLGDDLADVIAAMEATEDDLGAAQAVAEALFNKRVAELADADRYEELVGPIDELPDRWGSNKKGGKPAATKKERPSRSSRRKAKAEEPEEVEAPAEPEESRDDKFAALKARVETK